MSPARKKRARRRRTRSALVLACAAGLAACAAGGAGESASAPAGARPPVLGAGRYVPALRALEEAVEGDQDELARSMIAQLRLRPLDEREREVIAAFERILDGRELVAAVDLRLEVREQADGGQAVLLTAFQDLGSTVTLRLPPGDLEHLVVAIDGQGMEGRRFDSRLVEGLDDLELKSGERITRELSVSSTPLGRALALRELWRLSLRSGEILRDGVAYPAGRLPRPTVERVALSEDVPEGPAAPAELVDAIRDRDTTIGELMRIAVRIDEDDRAEALRVLTPEVEVLASVAPERSVAIAPALRWIARTSEPGADPRAWVRWLRAWNEHERARELGLDDANLDLPGRRDPATLPGAGKGGLDLP